MESTGIQFRNNGKIHFARHLALSLFLISFIFPIEAKCTLCCIGGSGSNCWEGAKVKKKRRQMMRTFVAPGSTTRFNCPDGQMNGTTSGTPVVVTYADLNYAYSPQNNLYYYNQSVATGSMNIGTVNKVTAQQWYMPNCSFNEIDSAVGIPVAQTPYFSEFPTATHCKLYEYPEDGEIYSYFEYYGLNPDGITLLGSVDDFDPTPFISSTNLFIAPLAIDINFHLVANDTITAGNQKKILSEVIDAEGFGTLTTPWGNLDVIKILNHYNEFYYQNGILVDEFHQPVVTFISKNGNALDITLPEGSPTTGTVATEQIEFTRIVYDSFATVKNVTLGSGATRCDDAFGTITVAGGGTSFTANSGSTSNMISGHNIKYMPGTKVKPGGKMRGYITNNGPYCPINYTYPNPWGRGPDSGSGVDDTQSAVGANMKLRVFPNPTTGDVTIQLPENEETGMIKVEITDINGIAEISENLTGARKYNLSVESLRPGMYLLHATTGKWKETLKLVRL